MAVQCGTPAPAEASALRTITVPVTRLVLTHSDHYGPAEQLGLIDRVVAIGDSGEVSGRALTAATRAGRVRLVGAQTHLDLETFIALRPDVILSYWSVSPEWNAPAKLEEAGLKSGAMVAHWERTPLGAMEWVGVLALFGNLGGRAQAEIARRRARYDSLRALVPTAEPGPAYITGTPGRDRWGLMRLDHLAWRGYADAGLTYAFTPLVDSAAFPATTLEAALAVGREAPLWLEARGRWQDVTDLIRGDQRLGAFQAVRDGAVWAFDRGHQPPDKTPWDDQWLGRPDEMLADLIAIVYPDRLPGHRFAFGRPLTTSRP